MNNAALNTDIKISLQMQISVLGGVYPEMELLDIYIEFYFQFFRGTATLFFLWPLCHFVFPPTVNKGSDFSTCSPTLFFDSCHSRGCESWYLMVLIGISIMISDLSIFSCACWLFYILWRNVKLGSLLILCF